MWRWVGPHLERRRRGDKHPVLDFLFEYYFFKPSQLLEWRTGCAEPLPAHRRDSAQWILALLEATANRPPAFACFGLHEWAMVYETAERRHGGYPLRLSLSEINAFVRSQPVCCTHFDAYRFFTPAARPLNHRQLSRDQQLEVEQPGCLHANMDLYKWATKFWPWIPSDVVGDTFELAVAARELDMRASPYDLRSLGYEPVCIETGAGREEYRRAQQELFARAQPVRLRLIQAYRELLAASAGCRDATG